MMGILVSAVLLLFVGVLAAVLAALISSRRQTALLTERLARLEQQAQVEQQAVPVPPASSSAPAASVRRGAPGAEFVITHLGEVEVPAATCAPVRVSLTGPAFADALVRESVVHTASFVHGLRRALAPETRNRIRFEMRRELKRTRKQRRLEAKVALREYRARHRAALELPEDVA